jgi:signal transduction histidine kinase
VLAGAASLGWLVARWATGPVDQLEAGARKLAAGDLAGRAEVVEGPPELQQLAATFDDMAARLEVLMRAQQSFVADASHQLRTPLTALRLRIESLEAVAVDDQLDPELVRADLEAIDAELVRLSDLVEGLLALARSESGAATVAIDVAQVVADAALRWGPLADEHGVELCISGPDHAPARAVAGAVEQILDNLLDNALGVAPRGSAIHLDVREGGTDGVAVVVRDHGPGMSATQRARATDRFWRAPDAPAGGTGLGLAIVAQLAQVSGGSVALDAPASGPGLAVTVRLPRGIPGD